MNLSERLRSETEHLSPADGSRIAARLRAEAVRRATLARCPTPIDLARYCDPSLRTSPAVEAISRAMRWALTTRRARLIISMPPQEGKLGSMDTVIPTTTGETTYRDVRVGDTVFHPSGKPIAVTEVHPPGSADRRVHFSDHSHLDVHAAHEWTVYDRSARKWRTVETRYLESQRLRSGPEGRGGRYRFQLPWHETLDLPEVDLPIDPYTLGLWLGNGAESGSVISRDPRNEYRYAYPVSSSHTHKDTGVIYDYLGGGLRVLLRTHHLLGNKHIPRRYLRASEQQRRALLAGLIDTDGYIPEKGQQISFDNTNRQMVFDVAELLRTLGYRAHVHKPIPASVGGEVAGRPIAGRKEFWRVTYSPHDGHVPTRLDRHRRITAKAQRRRVAVTRVEHIDPVPGRCITVDSPDGLYLAGSHFTPTHNSMGVGVWGALWAMMRNPDTAVVLGSYSLDLARQHSRTARNLVQLYGAGARDPATGEPLPDRLGFTVADDKAAANHWGIRGHSGGMYVAGRGGTMTGFRADCLAGWSRILTDRGEITIEQAVEDLPEWVVGYDEQTGTPARHRVVAGRRIRGRDTVTVTTDDGRVLRCTPDHRIRTGGGYVPAGSLQCGQPIFVLGALDVPGVQGGLPRQDAGNTESDSAPHRGTVLLEDVLYGTQLTSRAPELLRCVPGGNPVGTERAPGHMLEGMRSGETEPSTPPSRLPGMRKHIRAAQSAASVLFTRLRQSSAQCADDRSGELAPRSRHVAAGGISANALDHSRAGWASMRGMRDSGDASPDSGRTSLQPDGAPHQPPTRGQSTREPDNAVRSMSHGTSSFRCSRVVSVVHHRNDPIDVYDLQVDGSHNFIADGVVVHNCMIIDDPVSGLEEASSPAIRREVQQWWTGTVIPRLSASAPVILIATRWDERDLLGSLITEDIKRARKGLEPRWRVVNIPAVSGGGVADTLGRPPGVYLDSVRGRTPADWEDIREAVGPRVWAAVYLGDPRPAGSTVFDRAWFDRSRVSTPPERWRMRVVSVDPAETGQGDEAGVIALGVTVAADDKPGPVLMTHDRSGRMQSDAWSRAAVILALQTRADRLIYEAFVREFTYERVIKDAWSRVREQCSALTAAARMAAPDATDEQIAHAAVDGIIDAGRGHSFDRLTVTDDGEVTAGEDVLMAELRELQTALDPNVFPECWHIAQLAELHRPPYRLTGHRAKGSKRVRATQAQQAAEVGRLRMLGWHEKFEDQACGWMETDTESPDRMDALTNGYNEIRKLIGVSVSLAAPAAGHTPTAKPEQGIAAVSDPRTRSSAPSRGPRRPMRRTAI